MYIDYKSFKEALRQKLLGQDLEQIKAFVESQGQQLPQERKLALNWKDCLTCAEEGIDPAVNRVNLQASLDDKLLAAVIVDVLDHALNDLPALKKKRALEARNHAERKKRTEVGTVAQPVSKLHTLAPGDILADHQIIRELGRGSMGVVYLTQHHYLKKRFAVKVLPQELSDKPEFADIFLQEAQTLGNLKHPNIVEIYNFGIEEHAQYLVMEYVGDGNVEDYLQQKGGRLPAKEVIQILDATLAGLSHAHDKGIIHRDLKPDNLLRSPDGSVKISDFGLARLQDTGAALPKAGKTISPDNENTMYFLASEQSRRVIFAGGTRGYMAPEVEAGSAGDHRSDIYAIGVIAYYLLTGKYPNETGKPASGLIKRLDRRWDAFIDTCLRKNPARRYANADKVRTHLLALRPPARKKRKGQPARWLLLLSLLCIAAATVDLYIEPGLFSDYWREFFQREDVQYQLQSWQESLRDLLP